MKQTLIRFLTVVVAAVTSVEAQTLKAGLTVKGGSLLVPDFSIVAQTKAGKIKSTTIPANGKFSLSGVSTQDRLSLLHQSNFYSPVVLAVKSGKKIKTFEAAVKGGLCSEGSARVILTSKKKLVGTLKLQVDAASGVAYLKKLPKDQISALTKGSSALAGTDCLPAGTSSTGISAVRGKVTALEGDPDADGIPNETDIDDDDDGVSDAFDSDNDGDAIVDDSDPDDNDKNVSTQLFYFQQLHLNREDTYHPKLGSVTTAMIDAALVAHGGLALEVKSGDSVELNCGSDSTSGGTGLPWCSTGGTGRTREPYPDGLEFPESADADSDGKGEITAGPTGDLQLAPGAGSSEIQPGDTFIEEVTAGGEVTKYVGVLNSVVSSVPGIVSITTDVDTYTFDYPPTSTSIGTYSNPVMVPSTGDVSFTVTAYPPVYNTSAGQLVPGIVTMQLNIPNGPCVVNPGDDFCVTPSTGPGLISGSLFSTSTSGWSVVSDGIKSNFTDRVVDDTEPVTYTVNLTGTGGVTGWDAGESLRVPIMGTDNNGTTSAHNVVFQRVP